MGISISIALCGIKSKTGVHNAAYLGNKAQVLLEKGKNMTTRREARGSCVSRPMFSKGVAEQFIPLQKSSSVAPLADDVAHDLVNKLTVIKCWTEVMLRRGLATGKGVEHLQNILDAVDHAITLSEKLQTFSCRQEEPGSENPGVSLP